VGKESVRDAQIQRAAGETDAALDLFAAQNCRGHLNVFGHASLLMMHTGLVRFEAILTSWELVG
jgi:hypothetical protein